MNMPSLKLGELSCRVPIVQGGMGVGVSLSGLASAVAEQGGVGVLACVGMGMITRRGVSPQAQIETLTDEIRKTRSMTKGVLGVNIMCALSNFSDLVETSVREKVDVIFSGAGLPMDLPGFLKSGAKTKLVPIVSSGRAASLICRRWLKSFNYLPDGFVLEGPEAGGHLGFKKDQIGSPDFNLKKLLVDLVAAIKPFEEAAGRKIPIIAAGGVFDGSDIYELMHLGASGVQMGTRFVATDECDADFKFKQAYVDARKEDLEIITSPVGLPGRVIHNAYIESVQHGEKKPFKCSFKCLTHCDGTRTPYCIASALIAAARGKLQHGFAFAGSNVDRVKEIVPVQSLMDSLAREYATASQRASDMISNLRGEALK